MKYGFEFEWIDKYDKELNQSEIEHINSMIADGYCAGELIREVDKNMYRGWWKLLTQEEAS